MNGRIHDGKTAEERIAAVARSLCDQMREKWKREPDYADFREVLRPFVQLEIIRARIDEAQKAYGAGLMLRMLELAKELEEIRQQLPNEVNLRP